MISLDDVGYGEDITEYNVEKKRYKEELITVQPIVLLTHRLTKNLFIPKFAEFPQFYTYSFLCIGRRFGMTPLGAAA